MPNRRNTATRSTPAAVPAVDDTPTAPAVDDTPAAVPAVDTVTPAAVPAVDDTPTAPAVDDTPATPPADPTPAPAAKPADTYVDAFVNACRVSAPDAADADGTPHTADAVAAAIDAAVDAYGKLPGGARGGARASGMRAAIRGGVDGGHAIDMDERIPALAGARGTDTPVNPVDVYRDRVAALLVATSLVAAPDGAPALTDVFAAVAADGYVITDAVRTAAGRAVDAVTRGGGGRSTVTRLPLAQLPDGKLSYTRRGTVHHATLRDGVIHVPGHPTPFTDTTPAAVHVNGGVSVNGWTAWRYVDGVHAGQTLHAVSTAGTDTPAPADDAADADGGTADA